MGEKLCLTVDKFVLTGFVALHRVPQAEWCEFKGEDLTEEEDGATMQGIGTRDRGCARPTRVLWWRVKQ